MPSHHGIDGCWAHHCSRQQWHARRPASSLPPCLVNYLVLLLCSSCCIHPPRPHYLLVGSHQPGQPVSLPFLALCRCLCMLPNLRLPANTHAQLTHSNAFSCCHSFLLLLPSLDAALTCLTQPHAVFQHTTWCDLSSDPPQHTSNPQQTIDCEHCLGSNEENR